MARVLDSVTLPIKKNGTKTNQNYVNNPKSIAPQFSASTAYTAGQYVFYDKKLYRFKVDHAAGAWNAAHAEERTVGAEITELKQDLSEIADGFSNLEQYLYAENKYINASMAETPLAGYNLYKIPIENLDIVHLTWNTVAKFWNTISSSYLIRFELSDNSYRAFTSPDAVIDETYKELVMLAPSDAINFCVCAYADYSKYVTVCKNSPKPSLKTNTVEEINTVTPLSRDNAIISKDYLKINNTFDVFALSYYSFFIKVKKGDRFVWSEILTDLSRHGVFRRTDGTCAEITRTSAEYTFGEDAVACLYFNSETTTITYYPADSIKLEYKNIVNIPSHETDNPYENLTGVAFGTSLTYRAQTTGGYLQYLPTLSGITFDNQGVGSSTILSNGVQPGMLPVITGYTGYTGKRVCILEGFVNDWYYNGAALGTWKDSAQNTVCGCVRYALNYILTQNPHLTVFLVLDHYGKGISAPDVLNSANMTQFEFYQEIEKVALSMGIRVIREYELSEISAVTQQYLLDNIHLNDIGAKQSANAIWCGMKDTYPNEVSE